MSAFSVLLSDRLSFLLHNNEMAVNLAAGDRDCHPDGLCSFLVTFQKALAIPRISDRSGFPPPRE